MMWTVLALGGCSSSQTGYGPLGPTSPDKGTVVEIVTTTGMVRDLVANLLMDAGDESEIHITAIMGPGVDPHLYQPTRTDAVRLLGADLVVYNGLHLEGRLGEVLRSRQKSGKTTIAVGDHLPVDRLLEADAGLHDPHIWMDVALWAEATQGVGEALCQWRVGWAGSIRESVQRFHSQLTALDQWSESTLRTIPESQRVLITAHDAFRYFGHRYHLEVHGVQGISTMSEAAISDTNRLVELIVSRDVPAVFFETSVSPRQVKAIVEGAQRRGVKVSSNATLYSDSLGAVSSAAGTYIGMIQHNVRTIAESLGGTVLPLNVAVEASPSSISPETRAVPSAPELAGDSA